MAKGIGITVEEKALIDELRERLDDILHEKCYRNDEFLIRWIRFYGADMDKAEIMLRKSFSWRQENKIRELMAETIDEHIERHCPYDLRGADEDGRPVLLIHCGKWDIKELIQTKNTDQLNRHVYKMMERVSYAVSQNKKPSVLPGYVGILDADGANYKQIQSKEALATMFHFICAIRDNYPDLLHMCYVINSPKFVSFVFRMVKPILPSRVQSKIKIYGRNRSEWEPALLKTIPSDQISRKYGGTLEI